MSVIQRYHHHKYIIGLCHFFISHLTFRYSGCSSCSHTWDAFQLAHASFRLYCVRNNYVQSVKLGPRLLGDAPKINIIPAENDVDEAEGCSEAFLAIKIYDEDVNMKFLVCGVPCTLVSLDVMPHSSVIQSFSCFQSMIAHCSPKRSFSPFKHRLNATQWHIVSV